MNIRRVFSFGKIDFRRCGRKVNEVEVEVEIDDINGYDDFAICGGIWNAHKTDYWTCGQCLDTIAETSVGKNPLFKELFRLWNAYHLTKVENIPQNDREKIYNLLGVKL